MKNAQTTMAGQRPQNGGLIGDTFTLRLAFSEAGLTTDLCLDWLLDRAERMGGAT